MRKGVIEQEDIIFCLTEIKDLDRVMTIEGDKSNNGFVYQWTKEQHIETIESDDWLHLLIIHKASQNIIGYILLESIKNEHESIELTRITIKEKGKGYGRKALELIKKLCFEELGCHRLWLDVFEENKVAINLYEKAEFKYEGTLRDCKKYGEKYYSMRIMSMLYPEYVLI